MIVPDAAFARSAGISEEVIEVTNFPAPLGISRYSIDGVPVKRSSTAPFVCDSPGQSFSPACVLNQEACGDVVDASPCGNEGARMVPPEPSRRRVTAGGTDAIHKLKSRSAMARGGLLRQDEVRAANMEGVLVRERFRFEQAFFAGQLVQLNL